MDAVDAIRRRRAVRTYTDRPVPDEVVDRLLRLALSAPTGSGAQSWALMVVRDAAVRREVAEIVLDGATTYFTIMRPAAEGTGPDEHRAWARGYAERILSTYRKVPVWILGVTVPRRRYPDEVADWGRDDDLMSVAFAMENLFVAARAEGLGTVPTTAFMRFEEPRIRALLGLPDDVTPSIITPLGYPEAFPEGKPPALKGTFRPWKSLVHDDRWGTTRD